jgi:dTDP-4-dehydrorhamnose reductase
MSGSNATRILLTGGQGQFGSAIRQIAPEWAAITVLGRGELDITDRAAVNEAVEAIRPEWVINAAAHTAVDRAESERDLVFAVNANGVANLAEGCRRMGARMVQISTDYVFDGTKSSPYRPHDQPNPINVYGESKLAGEQRLCEIIGDRALVLRTAWVYSLEGPSFLTSMLRLMREREELRIVEDQVGTPTSAASLARAVFAAIENEVTGIHHWTDAGVASWYDFAIAIQEEGCRRGMELRDCRLIPILTEGYPTPARRPAYSVLDKTLSRDALQLSGRHWHDELRQVWNDTARAETL